jgi:hypothetical protein
MRPANQSGRGSNAKAKGRPIPGNVFDDRILRGPGCNRCLMVCADHFRVGFLATAIYVGAPTCVFEASRNLSLRCESVLDLDTRCLPTAAPPSPDNAPGGSRHPHRPDEFRPAIPWQVARQHCLPPLHRHDQLTMPFPHGHSKPDISTLPAIGHFYFALTLETTQLDLDTASAI